MAGQIKVDSINADSNLTLKIANTAVAFIDSSGLRPVSGNVSLDATATSKVFLPSANTVAIQTAGVTGLSMSSSQVVTLANALPVGSGGTGNTATPTAGGIIYGTGTVQAVSAAGTSGQPIVSGGSGAPVFRPYTLPASDGSASQILQTNGAGALSFATPATGAMVLLSTVTASASATVDMETTFSSTYDAYLIIGAGIVISSDGGSFSCRLKIGGSYSTTNYKGHFMQVASGSTTYDATAATTSSIGIAASVGNVTNEGLNFTMKVYLPSGATLRNMVTGEVVYTRDSSDLLMGGAFLGGNTVAGAVTGVRFFPSSGTITSGVFRLYGFANS